jgi:heptosyltransferase-2
MQHKNLLVWLPSPMGDAILSTPALRAIRKQFGSAKITFLAADTVRQVLSPNSFNDEWIVPENKTIFALAAEIKKHKFTTAILLKNSFGSGLAVFLAGVENRIGYSRDGRGFLLTDKLYPPKQPDGKYQPISMLNYYLSIASWLGADTDNRKLELSVAAEDIDSLKKKLSVLFDSEKPVMILVPGGAFGLSKCWPAERFAKTADWLIRNYNAAVVVSVSAEQYERQIAQQISAAAQNELINLAENPLTLGELKALFSTAELVICNDTGPRHIAIAFDRKVITMFGPNDPEWTQTGHEKEVQIIGRAPCAPCLKPLCDKPTHICMNSITIERVCTAADRLLKGDNYAELSDTTQRLIQLGESFFVDQTYEQDFRDSGLTSIDSVFSFDKGQNLTKKNLADYRTRMQFLIGTPPENVFLKKYEHPPLLVQLDKWLCNRCPITCGMFEVKAAKILNAAGVNTAKIIAYGQQTDLIFENRSFIIAEQVPNSKSLEQKLPDYFEEPSAEKNLTARRQFIKKLAHFIKTFHDTGFRHRDLYLCHIFCDTKERFTLIDLARAFQPWLLGQKFLIKDITQLYYSSPIKYFSRTDRLRFYKSYSGRKNLNAADKSFIRKVISKADVMARHDKKHGRIIPFKEISE